MGAFSNFRNPSAPVEAVDGNPFERFGIKHLSASSLNAFMQDMGFWAANYIAKVKTPPSLAMINGIVAETGVEHGLLNFDAPLDDCVQASLQDFDKRVEASTVLRTDPDKEKRRAALADLVKLIVPEVRKYGAPTFADGGRQHKISIDLEGVPVPIIGYLDFEWPNHGIVMDLKTTARMPSAISKPHARQGAIYQHARGNADMRFLYATPKKIATYRLEDGAKHLNTIHQVALRLGRFLGAFEDKESLLAAVVTDPENFKWNGALDQRETLFGY